MTTNNARTEMLWATCPHCGGLYVTPDPKVYAEIEAATAEQCDEWHAAR